MISESSSQMSSFVAGLFHSHLIERVLIVAPKTLLSHWARELSVVGLAEKTKESGFLFSYLYRELFFLIMF